MYFEFRVVAKVGDLVNFEACMDVMDLLYEKEKTSTLYSSPHSLAASVLVFKLYFSRSNFLDISFFLLSSFFIRDSLCSILLQVASYLVTVPRQRLEFPILPWGKIEYMHVLIYVFSLT